jgi:hypothetical protein
MSKIGAGDDSFNISPRCPLGKHQRSYAYDHPLSTRDQPEDVGSMARAGSNFGVVDMAGSPCSFRIGAKLGDLSASVARQSI